MSRRLVDEQESMAIRRARVALSMLVEPGHPKLWSSVTSHGPVQVLQGLLDRTWGLLAGAQGGVSSELRQMLEGRGDDPLAAADQALERARRLGARLVVPEDHEWPSQVEELRKLCSDQGKSTRNTAPPLCLWVRGPLRLDEAFGRSVAVVGARAATSYGEYVAREIGYGLAERGWTVVSGGAYGIDACAHRGALAGGGATVAVLACGVDRAYPAGNANLFDRISEDGLLISEWPPGAEPFKHRFLTRNRVIAAATVGTVMVEAGARSGARQTLRRARQLGRVSMVVPGPVTSAMSVGCHEELREQETRLVTGASHVLEEIGRLGDDLAPVPRGPEHPRDRLDPVAYRLVEALLKRKLLTTEEIAVRARVPLADARRTLPMLVLQGHAVQQPDGRYRLAPPSGG